MAQTFAPLNLSTSGEPEQVFGAIVSGNYFAVLGVKAALGRTFLPEEDKVDGKYPVVVLSHRLWNRRFGADRNLIGKEISLNRQNFTVLGVTPRVFRGTFAIGRADLFVPMAMHDQVLSDFALQQLHNRRALLMNVFGRLRPGVGLEKARAAMKTVARQLELAYPKENEARSVSLMPLLETLIDPNVRGDALLAGGMMMGVVSLVLLVACANVANLLLARAAARQREIALRLSLGASKIRLVRQLLTESLVMALLAGLLGLLLAGWGRDLLWTMRPPFLDADALQIALDGRVMSYTVAQRTQEIAIRLALGAQAGDVLKLILGHACAILAVGGLLGLAGGLMVARMLANLLYGIGSADPLSLAGTIVVLGAAALLASYLPARRALRVNPVETLRWE